MKHTIKTSSIGATKATEANDCAVRAFTNTMGAEYDNVHSVFTKNGRKNCGGTTIFALMKCAKDFGLSYVGSFGKTKTARAFQQWSGSFFDVNENHVNKSMTLGQLVKALPFGKYVVCIAGHALSLVDGKIIDSVDHLPSKSQVVALFQYGEMV